MIPYCWLKTKSHTEIRMWKLKYAENMAYTIRIRKLLLMKEFGNFKYDTEVYIKRILKVIIL